MSAAAAADTTAGEVVADVNPTTAVPAELPDMSYMGGWVDSVLGDVNPSAAPATPGWQKLGLGTSNVWVQRIPFAPALTSNVPSSEGPLEAKVPVVPTLTPNVFSTPSAIITISTPTVDDPYTYTNVLKLVVTSPVSTLPAFSHHNVPPHITENRTTCEQLVRCTRCAEIGHVASQCMSYKTRLCRFHAQGWCIHDANGDSCYYAHGEPELRMPWIKKCVKVRNGIVLGCLQLGHTFKRCPLEQSIV